MKIIYMKVRLNYSFKENISKRFIFENQILFFSVQLFFIDRCLWTKNKKKLKRWEIKYNLMKTSF